jgi:multicomponent Na+:H+ antiporter subunit D
VSAISLGVGALTLFSMTKIWAGVFWGEPEEEPPLESARGTGRLRAPALMNASTLGLAGLTLAVGILAQPIWGLCERAAEELMNPRTAYIATVMDR